MYKLKDTRNKEFALSFTHEEIFLDLIRKHVQSYSDLPLSLYHFSTKFRNELRAKSGILRGREFIMNDLYSVHASAKDLDDYYFKVLEAYKRIFRRFGFEFKVTEAGGGVFTDNITHELQVPANGGEDTIYFCNKCEFAINQELIDDGTYKIAADVSCPKCAEGAITKSKSIEVGNIFRFGTSYSEKMHATFTDIDGIKKLVYLGSYGIGTTRVMGTWVEVSSDAKGIIWSKAIAPFAVHLIELPGGKGKEIYARLQDEGVEVLWDDREVGAGQKFAESDLIGIPVRLVTSQKTKKEIEYKERTSEVSTMMEVEDLLAKLAKN